MMLLDHIAIIVSSEEGVEFYKKLGFGEKSREKRATDSLVYMSDGISVFEIYIDSTHPARVTKPEALGLRHLGFSVEKIEDFAAQWGAEIKTDKRGRFCFIYDPDCLPVEIREWVPKSPEEE